MPIEFQCAACHTSIRTADGTAGKPARCPRCGEIVIVPDPQARTAGQTTAPLSSPAPAFDQPASANPPAGAAMNPYAPPANVFAQDPFQQLPAPMAAERARSRLLAPAIGMIVFAVAGLGFMALVAVGFALDPNGVFKNVGDDPAQRVGAYGFFVAYFTVGLLTRVLQLLGAIAMLRGRGYRLALAGAISTVIPCEVYCCLPCLPFGIWALIVLNNRDVKAAFR
jgi:hypothetical protein